MITGERQQERPRRPRAPTSTPPVPSPARLPRWNHRHSATLASWRANRASGCEPDAMHAHRRRQAANGQRQIDQPDQLLRTPPSAATTATPRRPPPHHGKPIKSLRRAWRTARKDAGRPGLLFHELRPQDRGCLPPLRDRRREQPPPRGYEARRGPRARTTPPVGWRATTPGAPRGRRGRAPPRVRRPGRSRASAPPWTRACAVEL